jgi:hypothetical protein
MSANEPTIILEEATFRNMLVSRLASTFILRIGAMEYTDDVSCTYDIYVELPAGS